MLLLLCGCILLLFLLQVALQRSQSKRIALCAAGAVVMFGISASKKYFSDLEG